MFYDKHYYKIGIHGMYVLHGIIHLYRGLIFVMHVNTHLHIKNLYPMAVINIYYITNIIFIVYNILCVACGVWCYAFMSTLMLDNIGQWFTFSTELLMIWMNPPTS